MAAIPEVVQESYKLAAAMAAAEPDQETPRRDLGDVGKRNAFPPPGRPPGSTAGTRLDGSGPPLSEIHVPCNLQMPS